MGLQGPPYAVLSPLVTDPLAPPGDPESSLFLTCHFARREQNETRTRLIALTPPENGDRGGPHYRYPPGFQ